jgi:hypothetical protein
MPASRQFRQGQEKRTTEIGRGHELPQISILVSPYQQEVLAIALRVNANAEYGQNLSVMWISMSLSSHFSNDA